MKYALDILHYNMELEMAYIANLGRLQTADDSYWNWWRNKAIERCRELREAIEILEGREERTLFNQNAT